MKNQDNHVGGAIYVAYGDRYVSEALYSAKSLKRQHRELAVCVYTDATSAAVLENDPNVDKVVVSDPSISPFQLKVKAMMESPYERTLFLDSDTKVVGPVDEPFDYLDDHDVAISAARWITPVPTSRYEVRKFLGFEAPNREREGWPVFNTGVLFFRKSASFLDFANKWLERIPSNAAIGIDCDQMKFNEMIVERIDEEAGLRIRKIPNTRYNCRLMFFPHMTSNQRKSVSILHEHLLNQPLRLRYKRLRKAISSRAKSLIRLVQSTNA